ncbi:MAG: YfbK domain-containing protein [Chitinophagaceae bacterium]
MKGWLLWLFLLLLVPELHAQSHRITGVVLDGNTVTLLSGVHINMEANQKTFTTDSTGRFEIKTPSPTVQLKFQLPGYYSTQKTILPHQSFSTIFLYKNKNSDHKGNLQSDSLIAGRPSQGNFIIPVEIRAHDDETYEEIRENPFEAANNYPLSSFTLNANDAAYCNIRRFIMAKQLPPKEAVRIEEMVNYFHYEHPVDTNTRYPMSFFTQVSTCPWHSGNWLLEITARAIQLPKATIVPSNIVLLIDVSGSMDRSNKLPLLKTAFSNLVEQLDPLDKISIVIYAGDVSVILPPTPCNQKSKILDVIHNLYAGGSTAGGAGIEKAFEFAKANFIPNGNNRIIIATDGDFNVGKTSDEDMRKLVMKYHHWGIYLTCIGVGMGNYKDSKLETLAQWGQGNFAYLDNEEEAQRIFNSENYLRLLIPVAANARMKVIFNPEVIASYRLIGYESNTGGNYGRAAAYFPGSEIGYGQSITAFYELQPEARNTSGKYDNNDYPAKILSTIALQYQTTHDSMDHVDIKEIPCKVIDFKQASSSLQFSAAVTLFGMLLRQSSYIDKGTYQMVEKIIRHLKGRYNKDERKAFLKLVEKAEHLPPVSSN